MNKWERLINEENTKLAAEGRAIVIQIPTPHNILHSYEGGQFLVAFRDSTVDFIGGAQGVPVAFEAKETDQNTLTLYGKRKGGLKRHQRNFLAHWCRNNAPHGMAFVYLRHTPTGHRYILPVDDFGQVASVDPEERKSFKIDPDSEYRVPDGMTWLDFWEQG
jgi:recombination protein U